MLASTNWVNFNNMFTLSPWLETLYATENGIGLAATQVGRQEAIVIIDLSESRDQPLVLINPEVISGTDKAFGQEGCLSVPDYYADVERYRSVKVSALDREGTPITIESSEFLAIGACKSNCVTAHE